MPAPKKPMSVTKAAWIGAAAWFVCAFFFVAYREDSKTARLKAERVQGYVERRETVILPPHGKLTWEITDEYRSPSWQSPNKPDYPNKGDSCCGVWTYRHIRGHWRPVREVSTAPIEANVERVDFESPYPFPVDLTKIWKVPR
jgi:hypothetical protein